MFIYPLQRDTKELCFSKTENIKALDPVNGGINPDNSERKSWETITRLPLYLPYGKCYGVPFQLPIGKLRKLNKFSK